MRGSFSIAVFTRTFITVTSLCQSIPALAVDWTITDLGVPGGGTYSAASGINSRGQISGWSFLSGDMAAHAYLFHGATAQDLYTLGGSWSTASGIDIRGQVVGISSLIECDGGCAVPFLHNGTMMQNLGVLDAAFLNCGSMGINANGQAVGWCYASWWGGGTAVRAFLYDGTSMRDLDPLVGFSSWAYAINNSGQVVGGRSMSPSDNFYRAFLRDSTGTHDLPTLGGTFSSATGMNDYGQVVGWSDTSGDLRSHAFLYDGSTIRDLDSSDSPLSWANGINNRGQVVGVVQSNASVASTQHGFLYNNGVTRDLDTLPEVTMAGWQNLRPAAINDSGQIVGVGTIGSQDHAFRLHPQTTSRYMTTVDSVALFNLGCAQTNQSGLLILGFGQPWVRNGVYGTIFPGTTRFVSIANIEIAVRYFLNGYYGCRGTGLMTVAVGTNNYGTNTTFAHGQAWGRMVARLNNYISRPTADLRNRLAVVGASDIEMAWNTPVPSRRWVDGYASTSPVMYYNFGDAQDCPTCANGWALEDVWYVSWGNAARPLPVPQIYNTGGAQTRHWQAVTTYGRTTHGMEVFIPAALTQWQACRDPGRNCDPTIRNTPVQAWYQLINMLHGVVGDPTRVQNILYSSDITWQN